MDLHTLLEESRTEAVSDAIQGLSRATLPHYTASRAEQNRERLEPAQYPEAFGLVSTALGAGKQALAIEYVALASRNREVRSLDLTALFKGTT